MTGKEILRIDDISVSYGNIKALHGVSMSVKEGEIVALIGANGAGKSTLLKAIVGQEPLQTGSIYYDGELLYSSEKHHHNVPTYTVVKKGIALVPEGRRVFADLTVEENLDMGAFMLKDDALIKRKKDEEEAAARAKDQELIASGSLKPAEYDANGAPNAAAMPFGHFEHNVPSNPYAVSPTAPPAETSKPAPEKEPVQEGDENKDENKED